MKKSEKTKALFYAFQYRTARRDWILDASSNRTALQYRERQRVSNLAKNLRDADFFIFLEGTLEGSV